MDPVSVRAAACLRAGDETLILSLTIAGSVPRRAEVDEWFSKYENPQKDVMQTVRTIILDTDSRIDECIKWQTPTFVFEGNIASFNPKAKSHVSLLFHQGAKMPGKHPRLQGGGSTARYMNFADAADAKKAAPALRTALRAWIKWKTDAPARKK